jgi:hypothetical protein
MFAGRPRPLPRMGHIPCREIVIMAALPGIRGNPLSDAKHRGAAAYVKGSGIAWSPTDSITVFGHGLPDETPGHLSFGQMAFLELPARMPMPNEPLMFNARLVTLGEHGLTSGAIVVARRRRWPPLSSPA